MAGSGREVKIDQRDELITGFSSVDLAHLDLTGCEKCPKQHRNGFQARKHRLGLDLAVAFLV